MAASPFARGLADLAHLGEAHQEAVRSPSVSAPSRSSTSCAMDATARGTARSTSWLSPRPFAEVHAGDAPQHQVARKSAQGAAEVDGLGQAEGVRAARTIEGGQLVEPDPGHGSRCGVGPEGVDHDRQVCPGPGVQEPGGLTVEGQEPHRGRQPVAEVVDDDATDAVVATERVVDADDHHRRVTIGAGRGHRRATSRSRKCVAHEMQGS